MKEFEQGRRVNDPQRWLVAAAGHYDEAIKRDPALAEAHAQLAFLLALNCDLGLALAAIGAAENAGADLAPPRYRLQRAAILARFGDEGRRQEAENLYEAQSTEALARFEQGLLAWERGDWARGRDRLAQSSLQLEHEQDRAGWVMPLPEGPWLLGRMESKRCLLRYATAVAAHLAQRAGGVKTAWENVAKECSGIDTDARALVCARLPAKPGADAVRSDLECPAAQFQCPSAPEVSPAPRKTAPQGVQS